MKVGKRETKLNEVKLREKHEKESKERAHTVFQTCV